MQNLTNYIIGIILIACVGFIVYTSFTPTKDVYNKLSQEKKINEEGMMMNENSEPIIATNTQITSTEVNKNLNNTNTKNMINEIKDTYKVTMTTNKGVVVLELNHKIAPKTVENFVKLSKEGFYDGVRFHRVIKDFMIQSGDPLSKDLAKADMWGTGGPGYKFEDEITDATTYKTGYKRGVLAMANSGPNTNGSQFFIMHKDVPLPPNYTIFGKVVSGLETVDAIAETKTAPNDRPISEVVISKISVE